MSLHVSAATDIGQDALASIRPISLEAHAKRAEHRHQLRATSQSLITETASNLIFFTLALKLQMPHIEQAAIGAALVYAPLIYEGSLARNKTQQLSKALNEYKAERDPSVFDGLGLTFRGNRPLEEERTQPPFFSWKDILSPLNFSKEGGIAGSSWTMLRYSAQDLGGLAKRSLSQLFGKKSQRVPNAEHHPFEYANDPCSTKPIRVMRTRLPHINNDAFVQMPAHPKRLEKSLKHTNRAIRSDHAKIGANIVGVFGAAEFCMAVGSDFIARAGHAVAEMDPGHGLVASGWLAATVIGMGPAQHFMDDAKKIHKRLMAKLSIADRKIEALRLLHKTQSDIRNIIGHIDFVEKTPQLKGLYDHHASAKELLTQIDPSSLDEEDQKFLMEHGVLEDSSPAFDSNTSPAP